jgi:hypothetical protein
MVSCHAAIPVRYTILYHNRFCAFHFCESNCWPKRAETRKAIWAFGVTFGFDIFSVIEAV